ncbi:T9SS type A sorting domain-containing protein [Bacteroidota bacterium]
MTKIISKILFLFIFLYCYNLFAQDPAKYHGGSYDGFAIDDISTTTLNGSPINNAKYYGGKYDGFALNDISLTGLNGVSYNAAKYYGGKYDGFTLNNIALTGLNGVALNAAKYYGGKYDGFALNDISLTGLNGVALNAAKFYGGKYDGFALNNIALTGLNGVALNAAKYYGGKYDGFALNSIALIGLNGVALNAAKYFGGSFDGFSMFLITQIPLHISLSSFTSNVIKNNVELKWTTERETNNRGFSVERSNTSDSTSWNEIDFVNGSGNTNHTVNYTFTDRKLNTGKYNYRLKQIDFNGSYNYHNLGNEVEIGIPSKFSLSENYPNPFNPITKIDYELPVEGIVSIVIFDITGREIATLVKDKKKAGYYTLEFDGSSIASGMYFYRIIADDSGEKFIQTKKMLLIK